MRARLAFWVLLPLGWALACGGRFAQTASDDDDTGAAGTSPVGATTGRGGSGNRAGTSSKAGAVSRAGTGTVGGSPSSAGTATGGACFCDGVACEVPFRAVPNADGCCYHCELDWAACARQLGDYLLFRNQIVDKYASLGCASDADCGYYYDKNICGAPLCGAPVPNAFINQLAQNLDSYEQSTCSPACPPAPVPPCAPPPGPRCIMTRCQ